MKPARKDGFTLLELLVALAILGMIVVICGRIFEQANISWTTGSRKAEMNIVGRGIADFVAQDISRCLARTASDFSVSGNTAVFKIIDEAGVPPGGGVKALQTVTISLSGTKLERKAGSAAAVTLAPDGMVKDFTLTHGPIPLGEVLPGYVDVTVTVQDEDNTYSVDFTTRAWLANRDRYKYDE